MPGVKKIVAVLLVATAILAAVIIGSNQPTQVVNLTNKNQVTINIEGNAYEPQNIKIHKGTKVTWVNRDSTRHNVMEEHEGSERIHDAPEISEVDPDHFAGPLLKRGESYSFTFNEVGQKPYHCAPHPYMKGNVTVVAANQTQK